LKPQGFTPAWSHTKHTPEPFAISDTLSLDVTEFAVVASEAAGMGCMPQQQVELLLVYL
jgi:hypothetical protein